MEPGKYLLISGARAAPSPPARVRLDLAGRRGRPAPRRLPALVSGAEPSSTPSLKRRLLAAACVANPITHPSGRLASVSERRRRHKGPLLFFSSRGRRSGRLDGGRPAADGEVMEKGVEGGAGSAVQLLPPRLTLTICSLIANIRISGFTQPPGRGVMNAKLQTQSAGNNVRRPESSRKTPTFPAGAVLDLRGVGALADVLVGGFLGDR
ncbi:hypothetical protein EYF80_014876 [Liparis tanakae]|uniref:Uncharacterized protein n=1 Tax=Liparis tanakae TaxID=230148 RepID=A0A4Z2IAE4_9TELE|nr:hypothetical protein EYF80_014876 [Liparis tanakae]